MIHRIKRLVTSAIEPGALMSLLIVLAFTIEWLAEDLHLVPPQAEWTIEAVIALLVCRAIWETAPGWPRTAATDIPLAMLVVSGVASALLHGQSLWTVALGARVLFRFIVLYYALLNVRMSNRTWRWLLGLSLGLAMLQIPLVVYQFGVLGKSDDAVFGSLRSSGALMLVLAGTTSILAARYIWVRDSARYLTAIAVLFVPAVLGEGKGFLLLAPIAIAIPLVFGWQVSHRRALTVASAFLASLMAAVVVYGSVSGNVPLIPVLARTSEVLRFATEPPARTSQPSQRRSIERPRDPVATSSTDVSIAASAWPRIDAVRHAYSSIAVSAGSTIAGFGVGSRTFTRAEVDETGSTVLYVAPIARRIYETGLLGLVLHWTLLAATIVAGWNARLSVDPFWRALAYAFPGIVLLYAAAEAYTETLMDAPALLFWLLAAALASHSRQPRVEKA